MISFDVFRAKVQSPSLRLAATLALTKFMCVSGQYCEGHLLLLLKILETSKDPSIRSNIVIALGDIAVSFGNIMDDVSSHAHSILTRSLQVELRTVIPRSIRYFRFRQEEHIDGLDPFDFEWNDQSQRTIRRNGEMPRRPRSQDIRFGQIVLQGIIDKR